jgi:hypothetical protein
MHLLWRNCIAALRVIRDATVANDVESCTSRVGRLLPGAASS